MTKFKISYLILVLLLAGIVFAGCKDAWKAHNELNIPRLEQTLLNKLVPMPASVLLPLYW